MKNIVIRIIFLIIIMISYFYLFIFSGLLGIINVYSKTLFYLYFIIIPLIIILVLLMELFNRKYKQCILKMILIHLLLVIITRYGIIYYMNIFTKEKWSNIEWKQLRYLMIDDFEKKYNINNMKKDEIIDALGDCDYQDETTICYEVKRNNLITLHTYCLEFNDKDKIIYTNKSWILEKQHNS